MTGGATLSFEVFPPKNESGAERLWSAAQDLSRWNPQFVSVTCGAGGSAIDGTVATAGTIQKKFGLEVVPHVAIARQRRSRLRDVLRDYKNSGVKKIVAVRGDESLANEDISPDDMYPNTIDFVAELKTDFGLEPIVAAYPDVHPRAQSPAQDMDHLRRKVAAGAAMAISQFFFLPETFLRFRDKMIAAGIKTPLAPGIMPIHSLVQVIKFAGGCGTNVPAGFAERFERHGENNAALFDEGVAHAFELCETLRREGATHFHFYTLNRSEMTSAICEKLEFGIRKKSLDSEPLIQNPAG